MTDAAPPPKPIIEDMAWCWWTRPRATRIGGDVYFGAMDHAGGMVTAKYDLATGETQRAVLAQFEDDDHNNPALLAVAGKPLVCFYSRHDLEAGLRCRISTAPLGLDAWHPEQRLPFDGLTTYAQVHDVNGTLHLFTRVDETRWSWCMSTDWAQTWSTPRDFFAFDTDQQVYMATALLADGKTMRVGVSGHPKEYEKRPLHDVWACIVDLETGEVTLPSGGAVIGNLKSGAGMPLNYSALELVEKVDADRTTNLFDVSSGPVFEIGYVTKIKDDMSTRDARYHVASLREGKWHVEGIAPAGKKFGYIHAGLYVGGVAFPDRAAAGQVYLTREEAGLWHLELWTRDAQGAWSGKDLVAPGTMRLTRPWAISPPDAKLGVVALALERYADDSYDSSLSHLVGAALPRNFSTVTTAPIGIGIIGCGWAAGEIVRASARLLSVRIVSVFDTDSARATALAEKASARVEASIDAILADPEVSIIYVGVPHALIGNIVARAIAAGKHVLAEKPLSLDPAESRRLGQVAEAAGLKLAVFFELRRSGTVTLAKRIFDDGEIGVPRLIRLRTIIDKRADYWGAPGAPNWRAQRSMAGGGVLLMNTIHQLDTLRYITGLNYVSAQGEIATFRAAADVEDAGAATLKLSNGGILSIVASAHSPGANHDETIEIDGSQGRLDLPDPFGIGPLRLYKSASKVWNEIGVERPDSHLLMLESFIDAILKGGDVPASAEDAASSVAAVNAIYRSAGERRTVDIA